MAPFIFWETINLHNYTDSTTSSGSLIDLRYIFTSGTKNNAVNDGKQMTKLGFRKPKFKR